MLKVPLSPPLTDTHTHTHTHTGKKLLEVMVMFMAYLW